jgi:hypothetical protein
MSKRMRIKELSAANIGAEPIDYDWYDEGKWDEEWESRGADRCSTCGKIVTGLSGGEQQHRDVDEGSRCLGYVSGPEPMMNYHYPIDLPYGVSQEQAELALVDLPLCLIDWRHDGYSLALTGGGMNLAWEICEAYMRIGCLPPVHFCDLPRMSGRGTSARDRWILAGCKQSYRVQMGWAKRGVERLRQSFGKASMKERR